MNTEQNQVREFMLKAGQECPERPTIPSLNDRIRIIKLIAEELCELAEAFDVQFQCGHNGISAEVFINNAGAGRKCADLIKAVDASTDLRVVVRAADVAMGIDSEPCWQEVHRSNMSKFIDGHKRADGKWIKGPSYSPANLAPIVEGMG